MHDFTRYPDLACERLGGRVLIANDEFFAPKENLIRADEPVFIEHKYTERGKWMDGWETRRRRTPGHDWCILQLGARGRIAGMNIKTSFFRGNFPESASIEALDAASPAPLEEFARDTRWRTIVSQSSLRGDSDNFFPVTETFACTHIRLNIFPDGGVARLRIHGRATPDWDALARESDGVVDLVAATNGGLVLACSDEFFSKPLSMIQPGPSLNMGDGWETKRRRGPGFDWCILALGCRGVVERIVVDTTHFKGNFPDRCSVDIADVNDDSDALVVCKTWKTILAETKLKADTAHEFEITSSAAGGDAVATHIRLNIYPDGGIARLRVMGRPVDARVSLT